MPNIFQQFGAPGVTQAIQNFTEAPTRQAISEAQLKASQLQQKEEEEKQKFLNSGYDFNIDPAFNKFPDVWRDKYKKSFQQAGLINENGIGTQRNHLKMIEWLHADDKMFQTYKNHQIELMRESVSEEDNKLQKLTEKGAPRAEIDAQRAKYEQAVKNAHTQAGILESDYKQVVENSKARQMLKEIAKMPEFQMIDPRIKGLMKSAIANGNFTAAFAIGQKALTAQITAEGKEETKPNEQKLFELEHPEFKGKEGTPQYATAFGERMGTKSPNEYKDFINSQLNEGKTRDQAVKAWQDLKMNQYRQKIEIQTSEQARDLLSDQDAAWLASKLGTKTMAPSQLRTFIGFGSVGQKNLSKVIKQLRKDYPDYNFALMELSYSGDKTEINKNKQLQATVLTFEKTAIQNAKQVDALSRRIDVSRFPVLNGVILTGKTMVGGTEAEAQYIASWRTIINEYARIATSVSGGGITSDTARKEIESILKKSYTPQQVQSVTRQLVLEMEHRRYGFEKSLHDVMTSWGESPKFEPKLPTANDIESIFKTETPIVGGAANKGKKIKKQFYSPSTGKTKYVYEDGTEDIR